MHFDLKSLELFVRVAALGAIGKAGAEFSLSATNATQRIKALEDDLGVKLLNRTTRSVSLTPDGETLLHHAKRILDNVDEARRELSLSAQTITGQLRVTASSTFGRNHIVPFIPEFLTLYPNVTIDLNLTDTVVDIVKEGYDLAFRIGELAPSSLLAQKIDDSPRLLVATPAYLEQHGTPQSPEDLVHHACLTLGEQSSWQFMGPDGAVLHVNVSGPVKVNLGDAMSQWVLADMGISIGSLWRAGPDIHAGRLVPILTDYKVYPDVKIWAVRPPGRLMHARVKAFLDFMQARITKTNLDMYGDLL